MHEASRKGFSGLFHQDEAALDPCLPNITLSPPGHAPLKEQALRKRVPVCLHLMGLGQARATAVSFSGLSLVTYPQELLQRLPSEASPSQAWGSPESTRIGFEQGRLRGCDRQGQTHVEGSCD